MIGKIPFGVALIGAGAALVLGLGPVNAGEIDDLKAEIEALQKRLAKIEAAQKEAKKTAVTAGETGGWKLPGSDTSVSFGGYVKGDFYLDNRDDLGNAFSAGKIRLDGDRAAEDDGAVGVHARQSRFRLASHTPTSFGALNTVIETDFYGGDNVLRLRHAYGSLGPVLAGQAWSLLVDEDTAASTVDFNGPAGEFAHRRPQLRLSLPLGEGFVGQAAVEPGFEGNELPTFLAALRYRSGWGAVNLVGAVGRTDRDVNAEDEDTPADWRNVSAHALHLGAHLNVTDATQLMASFNMTSGVNGLIWGGGDGAALDAAGKLKAQETMGGMAGVSHRWSDTISTGAYFGWVENDTADGVTALGAAGTDKALQTVHANVFWSPVPQANIGLEVIHGWREVNPRANEDKDAIDPAKKTKGEATRVQLGVQYSF